MNTSINIETIKVYIVPIAVFIFVVMATLTIGKGLFESIGQTREELELEKVRANALSAKRGLLASLDEPALRREAQSALSAVPGEDSLLVVLSTVRAIAARESVSLSNIDIQGASETQLNTVNMSLTIQGNQSAVLSYIDSLKEYAPLMVVTSEKITTGALTSAIVEVTSSWSPISKSIGKADTPINNLKASDRELLSRLEELKKIEQTVSRGGTPSGRTNPFAL